jgi:HK97 family phage prohead protease
MERRSLPFEIRAAGDGKPDTLAGYAAVFDTLSQDMGGWYERIGKNAFKNALDEDEHDVVALWAHDPTKPLASRRGGSLDLTEDETGLAFEMRMPAMTSWAKDAKEAIDAKLVTKMSFGFMIREGGDIWQRDGERIVRTIIDAELYEISPVAIPAYDATSVEARSLEAFRKYLSAEERASKQTAKARFNFALAKNKTRRAG